ncbi:Uncharacterized protein TPAR_05889 [Tolypocladium paradoxum]|uniref:Ribosome quality control complex subunit 1 n=1 Tax=Tolypocladium paradoxum TaxID=94208 RepID=A0A2S4KUR1_9HYPO|nr:Uncharacterized protein TPAR_05889 [Tolypocladium paradoxum]
MSSRQLRKLQQQRDLEKSKDVAAQESDGSEGVEEPRPAPKPRPNLFAALGGEDEDGGQDDDDEEDDAGDKVDQDMSEAPPAASAKKSKKKKKKKKRAKASAETPETAADGQQPGVEDDEIDRAIKELKINTQNRKGPSTAGASDGSGTRMSKLLGINTYHLKAANEMRNLFGREVIESANVEEQQETSRRRRGPAQQQVDLETFLREPPGAAKLPEVLLRRNMFVQGRDHWPRQSAGGLTMTEVQRAPDGSWTEYAYMHDKDYDGMQALFFACVQIGDPMRMVHLLKRVPYHVSTLLQVSSVAKQDQNMALAAELCERALFTFGRVTTSSFRQNIEHGRARLDFRRPENRQFWLAGYHYLKSLIRKGTYRTALEWAKLLYALEPKDPYAIRHFIHVLAIRARESRWLVDFLDELDRTGEGSDRAYLRQSLVLAKLQIGDLEGARRDLVHGVQRVPWLYCALFQELNLDAPPSIWGIGADSNARTFWVKLYIYQTKDLWNNAQATGLLQDVARGLSRVDTPALPSDDGPADLGATRLAYLEGQTSLLSVAPRSLLDSQPNYEFDPLPPPEDENIFTAEGTQLPWRDPRQQGQGQATALLARMQALLAQQQGGPAPLGAATGDAEDAEDDNEIRALREADDEELRRDLEAHTGRGRGDEPGLLATLMQMLGVGRGGGTGAGDGGGDDESVQAGEDDAEGLPGAWPAGSGDDGEADATDGAHGR